MRLERRDCTIPGWLCEHPPRCYDRVTSANFKSSFNFSSHLTQIVTAFVNILVNRGYMLKIWPGEVGGEGGGTNGCWVPVCSTKTIYFKIYFKNESQSITINS